MASGLGQAPTPGSLSCWDGGAAPVCLEIGAVIRPRCAYAEMRWTESVHISCYEAFFDLRPRAVVAARLSRRWQRGCLLSSGTALCCAVAARETGLLRTIVKLCAVLAR